jgi:hypothetical protein
VLSDGLLRAGHLALALAPGAVVGALLLLVALARGGAGLGWPLALAAVVYVGGLEASGRGLDATAPLVGLALLLCGELVIVSTETRHRLNAEAGARLWRVGALAGLLVAGLAASTLAVVVVAAPALHGLIWTVLGAAAAVGAAGAGVWAARREA